MNQNKQSKVPEKVGEVKSQEYRLKQNGHKQEESPLPKCEGTEVEINMDIGLQLGSDKL